MPSNDAYPVHKRSKLNRYRNRGVYDYDFIHEVVDTATVVHVAFPPSLEPDADPFPVVLPMIGCMGRYEQDDDDADSKAKDLYLHGYVSSRLMRLSANVHDEGQEEGFPVTVSATLVDGIVLSLTPNSHSYNYRSAVVYGFATPVTDEAEKLWAMKRITNSVVPERWENSRTPPTENEMTTTQILRLRVVSASGKRRDGPPNDDKHDMDNHEMREKVWTGVVPMWETFGPPVKAMTESKSTVPSYLEEALHKANTERETQAYDAMGEMKANKSADKSLLQRIINFGGS